MSSSALAQASKPVAAPPAAAADSDGVRRNSRARAEFIEAAAAAAMIDGRRCQVSEGFSVSFSIYLDEPRRQASVALQPISFVLHDGLELI
jgi:hypothetical protein